jgi:hypothetical protein
MIVNIRACGISRDVHKLTQTPTLIKKLINQHNFYRQVYRRLLLIKIFPGDSCFVGHSIGNIMIDGFIYKKKFTKPKKILI